jgi:hypothetical protein
MGCNPPRILLERFVPDAAHVLEQAKAHPLVWGRLVLEEHVQIVRLCRPLHSVEQVRLALLQGFVDEAGLLQGQARPVKPFDQGRRQVWTQKSGCFVGVCEDGAKEFVVGPFDIDAHRLL